MSLRLVLQERVGSQGDVRVAPPHPRPLNPFGTINISAEERLKRVLEQLPPVKTRKITSLNGNQSPTSEISRDAISVEEKTEIVTNLETPSISEEVNVIIETKPAFTSDEINELLKFKTIDHELLFNPDKPEALYQLIAMVIMMRDGKATLVENYPGIEVNERKNEKALGFQAVLDYLSSLEWIIPEEAVHASPLMSHIRLQREVEMLEMEQEPVVEEGNMICRKANCRSRRILRTVLQTKSGDEGFTITEVCTECGAVKRYS